MADQLFYGSVEKNDKRYKWVTEPNACKKCKALEGKVFETLEDFEAARPHPHCKCSYEEIIEPAEKDKNIVQTAFTQAQSNTTLTETEVNAKLLRLENDAQQQKNKLESALISLKMAKEFIREKIANLDKDMKLALNHYLETHKELVSAIKALDFWFKNYGKWRQTLKNLKNNKELTVEEKEIQLNKLQLELDELIQKASIAYPEAANLWKLSTTKFGDTEYIEENGKLLNSFIDIDEPSIRTKVKTKLESQGMSLKSRGVRFRYDSSLADSLIKSVGLKKYIRENRAKFKPNTTLPDASLALLSTTYNDIDLYVGIHNTDLKNIYIDFNERFTAKFIDTYDFNAGEKLQLVQIGNTLQNAGKIENYFIVVDIVIPKDVWENY